MLRKGILLLLLMAALLSACAAGAETEKLSVVATLFPQYDFVRQIAGERVELTLLLPPGAESHTYEPTPRDMLAIQSADLFVYTGAAMEPWAARLLDGAQGGDVLAVDASQGVELAAEHEADTDAHEEAEHQHALDPHIWLDPTNAMQMVDNICAALSERDPANAEEYKTNAQTYKDKLQKLDEDTFALIKGAARTKIVFGGRFAFGYFVRRYGLSYIGAYDSCSTEAEPSVRVIAEIIGAMREENLPVVYYEELVDPQVARSIAEQTGAEALLLHSGHNVTNEERETGLTFLDIMYQNLANLREGLYE